jgi:hypothetical protein
LDKKKKEERGGKKRPTHRVKIEAVIWPIDEGERPINSNSSEQSIRGAKLLRF